MQNEFPNAKNVVYLNTAAQGLLPLSSVKAMTEAARMQTTPQLVDDDFFYHLPSRCRGLLAELLHCEAAEIALIPGTGFGISAVALSLPLTPGDEVLLLDQDFPANAFAWEALRSRGISIRKAPLTADDRQLEHLFEAAGARTKALALSAVHFYTGYRFDLDAVSQFCRSRGIFFVVDGAQAAGSFQLDLAQTPVDALASAGHKWQMGPQGTGFLYVSRRLMPQLQPAFSGWLSNAGARKSAEVRYFAFEPAAEARRFELGTTPYILLKAYEASLRLLKAASLPLVEKHNLALAGHARERFREIGWSICESGLPSAIVSAMPSAGLRAAEIHARLREQKIYVSSREGRLRLSPHFYNSMDDIDSVFASLKRIH